MQIETLIEWADSKAQAAWEQMGRTTGGDYNRASREHAIALEVLNIVSFRSAPLAQPTPEEFGRKLFSYLMALKEPDGRTNTLHTDSANLITDEAMRLLGSAENVARLEAVVRADIEAMDRANVTLAEQSAEILRLRSSPSVLSALPTPAPENKP